MSLKLSGRRELREARGLVDYCSSAAVALGRALPVNYPFLGRDAFRTATGVHAAAIEKALRNGDEWLADYIYSSVPAAMLGRQQEICISHMSGAANVVSCLRQRSVAASSPLLKAILEEAKATSHVLNDDALAALIAKFGNGSGDET
jgi:2-isopropylmalate synthase